MRTVQQVLGGLVLAAAVAVLPASSQAADQVIRFGFQKYGNVILLKGTPPPQPASQSLTHTEAGRARNAAIWRRFVHKDLVSAEPSPPAIVVAP
jgi:hypothetical protein